MVRIERWSAPWIATGYRNARGFKIEFLTTRRGSVENGDRAARLPALDIGAEALAFLDLREPVHPVLLHEAGVAVVLPSLTASSCTSSLSPLDQRELAKSTKDMDQAAASLDALVATRRQIELGEAFEED